MHNVKKIYNPQRKILNQINIILDIALISFAWFAANFIYYHEGNINYYVFLSASIIGLFLLFRINKVYPANRLKTFLMISYGIFKSIVELTVALMLLCRLSSVLRCNLRTIIVFGIIALAIFVVKEYIYRKIFIWHITKHNIRKACVVVGNYRGSTNIIKKIEEREMGLKVEGVISNPRDSHTLGTIEEFPMILKKYNIELVIITMGFGFEEELEKILDSCEDRGVEVWLWYSLFERKISKLEIGYLGNMPMAIFSSVPSYSWPVVIKIMLDYAFALFFLPILCVLYILIGLGIKLSSPGPVLFKQKRAGLYQKPFVFLKFRSMHMDAEQRKEELKKFNVMKGPVFKVKNDPRIFPLGKFLRKTSLDELPQLMNILKGEMSVVGPRPLPVSEANRVRGWMMRRFSMKPGLTCLWQISGRSAMVNFKDWAKLDLEYIDNWSLWLDIKIFFKTIWVVLTGKASE